MYERADEIPSPYSAAWDINKIIRAEYEDPFYTKLALVSLKSCDEPDGIGDLNELLAVLPCLTGLS